MTAHRVLLAISLLAAGCAPSPIDHEAELAALRAAAATYHAAATAKQADEVVALYDETAIMIPPDGDLVDGLAAVRNYRFGFIETPGVELQFEITRAEVAKAGDMGWTYSLGQITINQPDGSSTGEIVRDFHTWKKQADGSWKVVVDMWTSGMRAAR